VTDIFEFLKNQGISFEHIEHSPVYTCEEANKLDLQLAGARIKNLFLRDKKGKRHFLLVSAEDRVIDLNDIAKTFDIDRLSFASEQRLQSLLDIETGAVSILALVNDPEHKVELLVDNSLWSEAAWQCHPTPPLTGFPGWLRNYLAGIMRCVHPAFLPRKARV